MFLTQRAIQSFIFLTSQLRDPETCYWVEQFTEPNLVRLDTKQSFSLGDTLPNLSDISSGKSDWRPNADGDDPKDDEDEEERRTLLLLKYHGLAAMDTVRFPTWESYFEEMLEQPTDKWIIASDQSHIPDYTWEIDPSSLCSRILSVREQLSREFASDLQAVSNMGGQTLDWYWDRLRQSREDERREEGQQTEGKNSGENEDNPFVDPTSLRGSRQNLLFLEINVDRPELDHKPSPLRRGNFDLLVLLATEEAIQRVLNRWQSKKSVGDLDGSEFVSYEFLEDFYKERQHLFQGPLPSYGKADDILEELLSSALSFKGDGEVINPTKIAEVVLRERERVALDWKDIALDSPQDHMKIQKLRLSRMMMGNDNNGNGQQGESSRGESSSNVGYHDPGPGAFE
ncbi:unnamed protein product [Pseudo-nitzschia multistriata]|uniref:Uncharacterized protein n=1 Tax=Pseudo-nitzschia multistriata TaxID=183589 RepID=A0A448ZN37_9STRA|nr:unnamed protein product [Pseudo-nitzschia multistriata]